MYDINDKVYYTLYIYMYIPILFRLLDARTIADFSNYRHYRRWCSEFLAYFGYFGIFWLFWSKFSKFNLRTFLAYFLQGVVYQNSQISGMARTQYWIGI